MESIKTIILQDEKITQENFLNIISGDKNLDTVEYCNNSNEVAEAISANKPIIVFVAPFRNTNNENAKLKIHRSTTNGRIHHSNERILDSTERVSNQKQATPKADHVQSGSNSLERYVVKNGSKVRILNIPDVMWIEADGNYINLVTNDKKHLVRSTLSGFLKKLDRNKFYQVHKSFIVNIDHVECFDEQLYGDYLVIMKNGEAIKMSRNYSDFLKTI
ncbi:MAG: LytTR family transcriptional regulator [Balneola sp.]